MKIGISPSSFAEQDDRPLRLLKEAGVEIVENPFKRRLTEEEAGSFVEELDGLIAGLEPLNRNVLAKSKRLKAIARVGIGTDNVDLAYAKERGIRVSNTPDGPTDAVAEMTLAALLAINRRILPCNADLHRGEWKKRIGSGIRGQKVLLIGYGRIGIKVSELLTALGADLHVFDPYVSETGMKNGEKKVTKTEGLGLADVVSLHASGREEILGAAEFEIMKKGVIILNSARGELVNEEALVGALKSGRVQAAWFDVFWKEPYAGELIRFDNVLLTPHIGTYTEQCRLSMETAAAENILKDLNIRQEKGTRP